VVDMNIASCGTDVYCWTCAVMAGRRGPSNERGHENNRARAHARRREGHHRVFSNFVLKRSNIPKAQSDRLSWGCR